MFSWNVVWATVFSFTVSPGLAVWKALTAASMAAFGTGSAWLLPKVTSPVAAAPDAAVPVPPLEQAARPRAPRARAPPSRERRENAAHGSDGEPGEVLGFGLRTGHRWPTFLRWRAVGRVRWAVWCRPGPGCPRVPG